MRDEEALSEEIVKILKQAGFKSDIIVYPRDRRSIDVVGHLDRNTLLLKTIVDASRITKDEINDLRKTRAVYGSSTMIIAIENNNLELENDVIYYKYSNVIVTPKTLEKYLAKKEKPLVSCIRGTYVLRINPEKLREKRENAGLSKGLLADILGTSKKAVYMYEKGDIYISLDKGIKLASLLGEDIFEELDLISESINLQNDIEKDSSPRDNIEEALYKLTTVLKCLFTNFAHLPIDMVIKGRNAISIVKADEKKKDTREKVEYAEKIAENVNTKLVLIRSGRDILEVKRIIMRDLKNKY
ncbi:MAG: helix-turn-helix domain-containing protein [Desulfurococcaceae archaeon]